MLLTMLRVFLKGLLASKIAAVAGRVGARIVAHLRLNTGELEMRTKISKL